MCILTYDIIIAPSVARVKYLGTVNVYKNRRPYKCILLNYRLAYDGSTGAAAPKAPLCKGSCQRS